MNDLRINYSSGVPLEEKTGYSCMVKLGNQIYIGGTTSVQSDGSVYGTTQYEQANYIFKKMLGLLEQAGSCKEDVYKLGHCLPGLESAPSIGRHSWLRLNWKRWSVQGQSDFD